MSKTLFGRLNYDKQTSIRRSVVELQRHPTTILVLWAFACVRNVKDENSFLPRLVVVAAAAACCVSCFFHFFLFCIQAKTFGNLSHGSFFVVTTRLDGLEGNKRGKSVLALGAHKNCICASLMGITRLRFFVRMSRGTQLI